MKKPLLLLLLFLSLFQNYAQNRANTWYFGLNAGLDFNSGLPIPLLDGKLDTQEGCATISDTSGNLLFYTDGTTVYNKNHQIMSNGRNLNGNSSSTHSAVVVPKPGSNSIYYIFTVDAALRHHGLQYSKVDMNLDNGLGTVIQKNILLYDKVPEKIVAYKRTDNGNYWIISQKNGSNEFLIYSLTPAGLNETPLICASGEINGPYFNQTGQIKISSNGKKLAMTNGGITQVFDFDETTGLLSNPKSLLENKSYYGIEFSPNSNLLYVAGYEKVVQFDLTKKTEQQLADSETVLQTGTGISFGSTQLGPDNKIYITKVYGTALDVIEKPNFRGTACTYKFDALYLNGRVSFLGLPTFVSNTVAVGNISAANFCFGESTSFSYSDAYDSIEWDFGDGDNSTSNNIDHIYRAPGTYDVKVHITVGTSSFSENKSITIYKKPLANPINTISACETTAGSEISTTINTSNIHSQILGSQTNVIIRYFDEAGTELPSPLPNPFTNTTPGKQSITARVYNANNPQCYAETTFDLVVNPLPQINTVNPLVTCDDDTDGQALFDISTLKNNLTGNQPNLELELFHENGQQVTTPLPATLVNQKPNTETLTARVTNTTTGCSSETSVQLIVNPLPVAPSLPDLIGCDDNNDGISEYFDTSQIETLVLNGQTGMQVSYYDASGNPLASPLPNPYTNTIPNTETLTVRVSNIQSGCYAETSLNLITSAQPQINQPTTRFACDAGNGYSSFDLSDLEQEVTGSQTGLTVTYTDETGAVLTGPLSSTFQNTTAWSQRIYIRVENATNALCFSETYLDLEINALPQVSIDDTFVICDSEPGLQLSRPETFDSWEWEDPAGTIISTTAEVYLTQEGSYRLTIGELQNGIMCTNTYAFALERSEPPTINKVDFADWSDNNFIEVTATGDGEFEYSLDGSIWQDSNRFNFIKGGVYDVNVRDKAGCGFASEEVILVDYMKVFTPNGDGFNDNWQIEGVAGFPEAKIYIFDRYGKLLKELSPQETGWDGSFADRNLPADDYWFHVDLGDGRVYKNHFTLKR